MRGLLARLEAGLREAARPNREVVRAGPFQVFLSRDSDAYHLSLAVPAGNPADWSAGLAALQGAFAARGRRARLEYFAELHPGLAGALEAAGFRREMTAPVMALRADALAPPAPVPGTRYRRFGLDVPTAVLVDFLRRQNAAFEMDESAALAWLPQLRSGLAHDTVMVAALEEGDRFVSGASLILGGEAAELAGVWTAPEERRRGLAFALCRRLLADYFATGAQLCWLSAAEGALGVYERLGFERLGTQLNYGLG